MRPSAALPLLLAGMLTAGCGGDPTPGPAAEAPQAPSTQPAAPAAGSALFLERAAELGLDFRPGRRIAAA
ncbi:MAG: hypothetical protein AAFX50_18160, partial [Acidobacteriota bacterium]